MEARSYRPCVGMMLINAEGLVFIGRRKNKRTLESVAHGYEWQMPQGGIDGGEEPYSAALRELWEETGVRSVQLLAEAPQWLSYELPPDLGKKSWKGRYLGQTQKWFALKFTGAESEINIIDPPGGHKAEFDAWRWEHIDRLPDLIVPFKRNVYIAVCNQFRHLTQV